MDAGLQAEYERLKRDFEAKEAASDEAEKAVIDVQTAAERAWRVRNEAKVAFNRFRVENGL